MRKLLIVDKKNTHLGLDKFVVKQNAITTGHIEALMNDGKLIIIDINYIDTNIMTKLIYYIKKHRYKAYCLDNVKDNQVFKLSPKDFFEIINCGNELEEDIIDLSNYKRIVHIGDIHGCYDVLVKAWSKIYNPNFFYIFLGDLIDRGKQNDKVIKFILSLYELPNVIILEGNHDTNLWYWSIGEYQYLKKYFKDTMNQLESSNISKEDIKKLCISIKENFFYKYNDKIVMASHGGLREYPKKRYLIDTSDYINSQCNDYVSVDSIFTETVDKDKNTYQIHGHSNFFSINSNAYKNSFNLEGRVEFGGSLRVGFLAETGFWFHYYKNSDSIMCNFFKSNSTKV